MLEGLSLTTITNLNVNQDKKAGPNFKITKGVGKP